MVALIFLFLNLVGSPFKSKSRLEAENAALRHQLTVLERKVRGRVQFTNSDRLFFIQLYRWFPAVLKAITIIRPETLVRWHRAGFRRYWRRKSRCLGGRPQINADLRALIRRMSAENVLWGAPAFMVSCSSSALRWLSRPSLSTWLGEGARPLRAGARFCASTPHTSQPWICSWFRPSALTCSMFWSLSGWLGATVWINVTPHPTAEWIAQQVTEAFPWNEAPRYLIRDQDRTYGAVVTRRLRAMGIRDKPIAPGSPWQNCFVEKANRIHPPRVRRPHHRIG